MITLAARIFRNRCLTAWAFGMVVCLAAWFASAEAFAQVGTFTELLIYPDGQDAPWIGTIEWTLRGSGQHEWVEPNGTRHTITMSVTIRDSETYDSQSISEMIVVNGTGKEVVVDPDPPRSTITTTTTCSGSHSGRIPLEDPWHIRVGPREGAAHFQMGGSAREEVPDIKSHTEIRSSDGGEMILDSGFGFTGRFPNVGLANTPYAAAAQAAENAATPGMPDGNIEAPWDGKRTHGQFSVPVLVLAGPGGVGSQWNTEPCWKAIFGAEGFNDMATNFYPGTLTVSFFLGDKPPPGEMIIEPEDEQEYEKWIPSPADSDPGIYDLATPLTIRAKMRAKEGENEGTPPQGRIDFWLRNVSRHKGKCTNYPLDSGEKDDLRFAADQTDVVVDPQDPKHAYTEKNNVSEASVTIEATDTGAYGTLQATCDDLGLIAKYEPTGAQSIAIPRDDNNNDVADQWEKDKGVFDDNDTATWDEDPIPANQRRNGDGYTLYEEYRGFMTKDGFVRTSPKKKDLFVYDPDGMVKQYYEPYNPAEVALHYIDESMMKFNGAAQDPDNRWVNSNSAEETWYARQYALYVVRWTTMIGVAGEVSSLDRVLQLQDEINGTNTAAGADAFREPLKRCYMVKVSPGAEEKAVRGIADPNVRQAVFNADMTSTVIHEIGHAIGMRHHHSGVPGFNPDKPEDQRPTQEQGGVFDCAMRYRTAAEYRHPELLQPQTRYCRAGETWKKVTMKKDAEGNKTATMEDVQGDDCFGQIDIKSDP